MMLIDTHCHLNFPPLAADISGVLSRAKSRDVLRIVVPAYDTVSWTAIAELGRRPNIYPALGVHPWVADQPVSLDNLADQLMKHNAVAVGEIGLDFKVHVPRKSQRVLFEGQLRLAAELDLPVLLHVRGAFDEMLATLAECEPRPSGVIHAFSRGPELAARFLSLGFHIAFGGAITHPRATRARRAAKSVPLERIVLETDAPSIALEGIAPADVEPAHTADVAAALAEIREQPLETIAEVTTENANRLFRLPPL
jgi:TatD DNase family protein